MKTTLTLAVAAVTFFAGGISEARPYYYGGGGPGYHRPHHRMSLQARAQLRLRELGYYHGPIDGDFGRGSRRALVRFQRDHRLAMSGWLDPYTIRALRL